MRSLLLFISLVLSVSLYSQTAFVPSECKTEKDRYCSQISRPKSKVFLCLLENESKLSEICRASLKASAETMKGSSSACMSDVMKFCTWVVPGGGRILKCLFKNEEKISSECRKELNDGL